MLHESELKERINEWPLIGAKKGKKKTTTGCEFRTRDLVGIQNPVNDT